MSCLVFDYILRLPVVITAIGTSRTVTAESMIRLDQPWPPETVQVSCSGFSFPVPVLDGALLMTLRSRNDLDAATKRRSVPKDDDVCGRTPTNSKENEL
ncbi:hypothetical protein QR685DRAFT_510769 [Neurospora intermedia]|uniref:Secreted protein n=1 Tax=Neurospora intermedia TaxID=5142 RepID=A0ABR3DQU7_NEUIN